MNTRLTSQCHDAIASALQGLDHVARQMELTWGIGRLPMLVDNDLRMRFNQQIILMNKTLSGDHSTREEILAQIGGAQRAWEALDRAARQSGAQPTLADVWEAPNPDGGVFLIVRDDADASKVQIQAKERRCVVYTLAEIGRLLSKYPAIAKIKDSFPGAMVTSVQPKTATAQFLNDDIPF